MQDAIRQERRNDAGELIRGPEKRQSSRQLGRCVEVAQVQDVVRYEAALYHPKKSATRPEGTSTGYEGLKTGNERPRDHLDWDPIIRPDFLANELGRQFSQQERHEEDSLAGIVVVRRYAEVIEHVVTQRLADLCAR